MKKYTFGSKKLFYLTEEELQDIRYVLASRLLKLRHFSQDDQAIRFECHRYEQLLRGLKKEE